MATKNSSGKNGSKKVIDIAKPGKTAADATARPVIIGHKPIVTQDPMVAASSATLAEEADKLSDSKMPDLETAPLVEPLPSKKKASAGEKVIKPFTETKDADAIAVKVVSKPATAQKPEEPKAQAPSVTEEPAEPPDSAPKTEVAPPAEKSLEAETKESDGEEAATGSDSAAVDSLAGAAAAKREEAKKQEEKDARQKALQKLVQDKKYYLPIREKRAGRSATKILTIVLIIVILGALAADLAVDAGLIKTSFKPPINLIK